MQLAALCNSNNIHIVAVSLDGTLGHKSVI